ncbi:MAG: energy-coupling factor transporter transmembrane component T family protein [Candidatus Loosdrechtia sp.]|uniref:energy-coupling factor transporter transmembrane component T family protein n=1 Tax=Candidatus Loosdrechtia sp. TaxID=3101272 RepID=UPI003A6CA374|nr:MAG: energy-coupling factor transporter transmembrane component T [Candidatus Jettenia sp. AMX2]
MSPPSTRISTVLVLMILFGIGLLDSLSVLLICLITIVSFAVLVVKNTFLTLSRCKGILIFFLLTGISLLWTHEGRQIAPVVMVKMLSMWLWIVVWITWVGFDKILSSFERLGIPSILIHIIAFTARFLPILSERLKTMLAAQASRGAGKGIYPLQLYNIAGAIGCLLIASFEQAENVERAMQSRGFSGVFPVLADDDSAFPYGSIIILGIFAGIVWAGVFLGCPVLSM